ncbi:hypothetical protein [Streptomyces sp. NBC_00280]|uniref:hypothetical protein n=1 Tax=Streptomyces sp. NBC_00280 TaxID=2975699 RepID=UPI00324FBF31
MKSGRTDNTAFEARTDVLTYTTPVLDRVQVSSGAFPRYNRNAGTGEPRATATTLRAADQQVFHDPAHPSAVILPVREVD